MKKLLDVWMPPDWSDHGHEIDQLLAIIHWLMLILFVGWACYFIYVLFRFRSKRNPKASYEGAKGRLSSYVEGGIVLAEAVLLVGFALPIWANRINDLPPEEDAIIVRVVAEQFAWNVHYPGPDGVFGPTDPERITSVNPVGLDRDGPGGEDDLLTINEIHLTVDQPVILQLSSKDVIHSLNLPTLRIKQDAIPGMTIPVWFIPRETGISDIGCAQLCGLGHFRMKGLITIESQEEFDLWLADLAEYQ